MKGIIGKCSSIRIGTHFDEVWGVLFLQLQVKSIVCHDVHQLQGTSFRRQSIVSHLMKQKEIHLPTRKQNLCTGNIITFTYKKTKHTRKQNVEEIHLPTRKQNVQYSYLPTRKKNCKKTNIQQNKRYEKTKRKTKILNGI